MKEKTRTIIIAGSVLVGLLAVALLLPKDAFDADKPRLDPELVARDRGIIEESLESLREFDARGEENMRAYYNEHKILAGAYERLGDIKKAREHLLKAIEYSDTKEQDYAVLTSFEEEHGNYKEARAHLEAALAKDQVNFAYWHMLIGVERNHFDLEGEALEAKIREAVDATDRALGSLVYYAEYLENEERKYSEAIAIYEEIIEKHPDLSETFSENIANLKVLRGEAQ